MPFSDQLSDLYGIGLHTRAALADAEPGLCRAFREGLLEGSAHALDQPQDAAAALAEQSRK